MVSEVKEGVRLYDAADDPERGGSAKVKISWMGYKYCMSHSLASKVGGSQRGTKKVTKMELMMLRQ